MIAINFTNPIYISQQAILDNIVINISSSQSFIKSKDGLYISPNQLSLSYPIVRQLQNTRLNLAIQSSANTATFSLFITLIGGLVLNFIAPGSPEYMVLMVRALQLVMHLPIYQV